MSVKHRKYWDGGQERTYNKFATVVFILQKKHFSITFQIQIFRFDSAKKK